MKLHLLFILTLTMKFVLGTIVPGTDPVNPCDSCCQGPPGSAGSPGNNGRNGNNGLQGRDGFPGNPGNKGERGDAGLGERGDTGLRGFPGKVGPVGIMGLSGQNGTDGQDGMPGRDGTPGRDGLKGQRGEDGRESIVRRSAFMVLKSNNQISSVTGELVDFNFVQTNIGNHFDINTDRFTCQIPGTCVFNYHGYTDSASSGAGLDLVLTKDNSNVMYARTGVPYTMAAGSATLTLTAGDQIWIKLDDKNEHLDCHGDKRCAFNGFLLYEE